MEELIIKKQAAEALKLTPEDMKKNKLIDKIIKEPLGGAHQNPEKIYTSLKKEILKTFFNLKKQKFLDYLRIECQDLLKWVCLRINFYCYQQFLNNYQQNPVRLFWFNI